MNNMYIVTFPSGIQRWFDSLEEAYPFAYAGYGSIVSVSPAECCSYHKRYSYAGTVERVAV